MSAIAPAQGLQYAAPEVKDMEKHADGHSNEVSSSTGHESDDSEEFQEGVQRVRAITAAWTKTELISMFCFLYLIEFVDFLQNAIDAALNPYITSSFGRHGLLNVSSIMSTALAGCIPLATAKVIDLWGRVEGFAFMLLIALVGMIMKAVCKNVETYIAAHVLYWGGHIGILYVVDVMIADMTSLKNRMIIFGINGTTRIASIFAGPAIADLFLARSNFRWAFGAFAIILTACSLPAMGLMVHMYRKAVANGLARRKKSDRTALQSLWYYVVQFDVLGILLIMFAFCLFLLPFSLVSYAPQGWNTPYIIAMIVLGFCLFPAFAIWEKNFAPVQFLPWKYLKQGTILGSCLLYGVMFLSTMTWNGYFNSYLQVVNRLSITNAGYVLNSFALTSAVFGPLIGWLISYTGNFKWVAYSGVPIMLLGTALIIPFRAPDTNPGVIALTQILVGLGTGIFALCGQLAVMTPVTHQQIAAVNALWGLFGSFGAAIGYAIASAMWTNLLPTELLNRLPESSKADYLTIYGDMVLQMSYADGSLEREAVVGAYQSVMRKMVIAGACLVPLCIGSIWLWKDINIKKLEEEEGKQTKGNVF
ncbi:MFS general substrate transporter [Corynespora cassiicola Philippines]|uniref:MFS general substrate transporter n=1 Tax=Corynespora cassiicola Philippines TaxID=1448308 RepID=A0A2T2P4G3_CORCC|nr:MFS general substrate transporter [Corynespora cassiicola Philippines]